MADVKDYPNFEKMVKELAKVIHKHSKKNPDVSTEWKEMSDHIRAYTIIKLVLDEYSKLPKIITEDEYLKALDVVRQYTKQVNEKSNEFLKNDFLSKTPSELNRYTDKLDVSVRVWNVLHKLSDVRLCDITEIQFKNIRGGGLRGWEQFMEFKESLKRNKSEIN